MSESLPNVAAGMILYSLVTTNGLPKEYAIKLLEPYVKPQFLEDVVNRSYNLCQVIHKQKSREGGKKVFVPKSK